MQAVVTAPMRDGDEQVAVLCMAFDLRHTEGRMLAMLLANDFTTVEQLRGTAADPDKKLAYSSMRVFLCSLREKLEPHNIKISTIVKLGYGIDAASRAKIIKEIAKYDAAGVGARPRNPEPELKAAALPD